MPCRARVLGSGGLGELGFQGCLEKTVGFKNKV